MNNDLGGWIATVILISIFVGSIIIAFMGTTWKYEEAPSGICYEIRRDFAMGLSEAMSPVTSTMCAEDTP
ncbi:hypothetical protein LCGC14_3056760 [marine sediment metagenome]|uniref:Uncharacterized protein n=1 Tax=marine sediment metagenome TaxID=412755 RepID=A0A0F8WKK0_9ZZZZ